ncbi:MAG TPA: BatA domain-containing protein [Gemmatimonadales bacterium]|nr:BatA domain-containing protein [Gemmatimonadales bacterium]
MIFLHPLVLFGIVAAAIPALLHLFQRRTPPEVEFPPLRYLNEAERRSARRLRLRHLLLLILRTALIVVLVLAAARPLVPARRTGAAHPPTALALILDNSLSSGAVSGGQVTLERLKAAARSVLDRATPSDRLWLVLADGIIRAGGRDELRGAVDSATADARRLDLVAAVNAAGQVVGADPATVREVQVVSDLQRTALEVGRVTLPPGVRVQVLAARPAPPNRGITAARVTAGAVAVSIGGATPGGQVPVTLRVRDRDVGRALAGAGATATLPVGATGPGWWAGEVVLPPDELRSDDRRAIVWHATPPARVTATGGAGSFVAAALQVLRSAGRVTEGADVTIGEAPGSGLSVVAPPADPALLGQVNRALTTRGMAWRFGPGGTPGLIAGAGLDGVAVTRRQRLEGSDTAAILATVNGEPWVVAGKGIVLLGSRLDTSWTALPTAPVFVPFVDALVNRFARGEAPVEERVGAVHVAFHTVGADTVGATVYGPDPRETDLTLAEPALIRQALGAEVVEDNDFGQAAFAGLHRADISGLLLALALLLAFGELAAATLAR